MTVGPQAYWPADTSVELDRRPIGEVLRCWAATTPDAPAVRSLAGDDITTLSYADLFEHSHQLARALHASMTDNRTVGVCAIPTPDWLVLEYAAALAGVPLVPVNPAFTDEEIEYLLETAHVDLLFADSEFRGSPLLTRLVDIGARLDLQVSELACWRSMALSDGHIPEVDPDNPFLIQYTSGTTGRPKGAVLSHRAAFNCARISMQRIGGHRDDNWLNPLPMHHVGGSVSVALAVLSAGACLTIVPAFEPGLVLRVLEATSATILGSVPTMLIALMEHPSFASIDLSALRIVQSGGSTVPPSLIRNVEQRFDATVIVAYGQSESPNAIQTDITDDDVTKAETIGRPMPQREVCLAAPDGKPVGLGEVGELWMRSPLTMDRYIGVPADIAAQTLDGDGWLHTGDLCSMDGRGVIRIHGRVRDVIIRGGENIYPAEVEDVLLRHPGVAYVAVIGLPDERWGEIPVACYRAFPGARPDPDDLARHARIALAAYKVPRRWIEVDSFPLTASGKVKKFELRAQLEAHPSQ
jgi:fatty-acyl-CoA synthase